MSLSLDLLVVLLLAGLLLATLQLLSGLDGTGAAGSVAQCAAGRKKARPARRAREATDPSRRDGLCPLSPFLSGRMFVREPSWKYSANLAGS